MCLLYFIATKSYNRCIDVLRDNLEFLSIVEIFLRTDD